MGKVTGAPRTCTEEAIEPGFKAQAAWLQARAPRPVYVALMAPVPPGHLHHHLAPLEDRTTDLVVPGSSYTWPTNGWGQRIILLLPALFSSLVSPRPPEPAQLPVGRAQALGSSRLQFELWFLQSGPSSNLSGPQCPCL